MPSNAKYYNCPPRMADGRNFTDYRPRCLSTITQELAGQPMNSYEYRQFLINNAGSLMSKMREDTYNKNSCGPCVEPFQTGTMLPEQSQVQCDANTCRILPGDPAGLGQGRAYMGSDYDDKANQEFIKRRAAENSKYASGKCCTPDSQFYPIDGVLPTDLGRNAVPGGGAPFASTSRTM
jgi:hypothetical protein